MDHGTLVLNAVAEACKGWGLSEYMTQTEFLLKISGAPGQVFDIEVEDDRDEAILFIDVAKFHTHFDEYVPVEDAIHLVRKLLTGEYTAQAKFIDNDWLVGQITAEPGDQVGSFILNSLLSFPAERIENYRNKVVL